MSDQSFQSPAVTFTAPPPGETTAPEVAIPGASAEQEPPENEEPKQPKVFTQEEVDAIAARERAAERRRYERQLREQQQQRPVSTEPPDHTKFKTQAEYDAAVIDWKVDLRLAEREAQKQQNESETAFEDRLEKARAEKYPDFDDVVLKLPKDGGPSITEAMGAAIQSLDSGADIAYYLGKNIEESRRIARLNPLQQAVEIGKIDAKLAANPPAPVKKGSSAPEPITPVSTRTSSANYSADDARSLKMPMEQWARQREKDLAKRRQG